MQLVPNKTKMIEDKVHTMRFGDFVRQELANPDSQIAKITVSFKAWKALAKSNPNGIKLILKFGKLYITERCGWKWNQENDNIFPVSKVPDVEHFWTRKEIDFI